MHRWRRSSGTEAGDEPLLSANCNYRKGGSVIDCEWYNSSLLDESGRLESILSLVLDVTERNAADGAGIVDSVYAIERAGIRVLCMDRQGRIRNINEESASCSGNW